MSLLYTITHPSRLHDVIFFKPLDTDDELLLAAAEDRKTSVYQLPGDSTVPKIIAEMIGHSNR